MKKKLDKITTRLLFNKNGRMKLNLIVGSIFLAGIVNAQGLVNNGAGIYIANGTSVYIDGGNAAGNFTSQDGGPSVPGIVDNNGTLYVTGDWINNSSQSVFTSNSGTVNLTGGNQAISGTHETWFNNLQLNGSGQKTMNVNTLVGGGFGLGTSTLELNSLPLDLNAYTLTVNNPGTASITGTGGYIISETNSWINPSIIQWNTDVNTGIYTFPFGVNGTAIPLVVEKISPTLGSISASTRATPAADNIPWAMGVLNMYSPAISATGEVAVVIDRWWKIVASDVMSVNLDFTYRGIENTTTFNPVSSFSAQNYSGTWSSRMGSGPGVLSGTASVTATGQSIGPVNNNWILSNNAAPLPIELVEFKATCENEKGVEIKWSTASELNVNYYTIEKSMDGLHFELFNTITCSGNSTSLRNYQLYDQHPFQGLTYYRLREFDNDGIVTDLKTAAVENCGSTKLISQIYLNGSIVQFDVYGNGSSNAAIHVYNETGQVVLKSEHVLMEGLNSFSLEKNGLSQGIYVVNLVTGTEVLNKKIRIL